MKSLMTGTILIALAPTTLSAPMEKTCSSLSPISLTFYGYPDNDPPSKDIAWDCGRGYKAGRNGTYTNPLTTATAPGEFNKCEILYLPYIQKYLIIEDTCAQCISDWARKQKEHHIDIWMESSREDDEGEVLNCENTLTPRMGVSVVRNPEDNYRVNDSPFWDAGECITENTYGTFDVPDGCSHSDTENEKGDGSVRTTPTQESSATRTIVVPTALHPHNPNSNPDNTREDPQKGSGFGIQARLGWWDMMVFGVVFFSCI